MQEANSLNRGTTFNLSSSVKEISFAKINEVSQGHWNNHGSKNYGNRQGQYNDKKSWGKQDNYKGKKDSDKKPWHNKDQKPWSKDQKSQQGNKESKPKDTCITVTKDVKYFCPTGYNEGIFNAVTKLLSEKVEQARG